MTDTIQPISEPLTVEQIRSQMSEANYITVVIPVPFSKLLNCNIDGLNDLADTLILGSFQDREFDAGLVDIAYSVVGHSGDTLAVQVVADASEILDELDAEDTDTPAREAVPDAPQAETSDHKDEHEDRAILSAALSSPSPERIAAALRATAFLPIEALQGNAVRRAFAILYHLAGLNDSGVADAYDTELQIVDQLLQVAQFQILPDEIITPRDEDADDHEA